MDNIQLLCDSHHGVYIPSVWCSNTENVWGIAKSHWEFVSDIDNLDSEWYWDMWNHILDNAAYVDDNNKTWNLHQDGDLFAYCPELMTEEEINEFFGD